MTRRSLRPEAFHMDHLRTTTSQQHLDPTSRSSSSSQQDHDDLDQDMADSAGLAVGGNPDATDLGAQRPHKLDLYSIPVFLLECIVLGALGYGAYFLHFQYELKPLLSGFYCDDISLRQAFSESKFTQQFREPDRELTVLVLLLTVPVIVVIFCELINSMFGSLKFRQIRSLCKCCKLHSITRRTLRFSGAYLLGLLIVSISCDILATSAGKFRPYFAQECPNAYQECLKPIDPPVSQPIIARDASIGQQAYEATTVAPNNFAVRSSMLDQLASTEQPAQPPVNESLSNDVPEQVTPQSSSNLAQPKESGRIAASEDIKNDNSATTAVTRVRRDDGTLPMQSNNRDLIERKWIDLSGDNLITVCQFSGDSAQTKKFNSIAMSWPSFPSAVFTYACLYLACYLSFVGTARPFRLITSVLVMILILAATIFSVQLVKEHYNHWEDVVSAAFLSVVVVLFVLLVYLNKFRDTHYYENQKLYGSASKRQQQLGRSLVLMPENPYKFSYTNQVGQYQLDKVNRGGATAPVVQNGTENTRGLTTNNDLPMRYFQIPRANYRGAPRPLSAMNQN